MITKSDLKSLGFRENDSLAKKQTELILALSYHSYNRIKHALIVRRNTLFVIKDYEHLRNIYKKISPKDYFAKLWKCERINCSNASLEDLGNLIEVFKEKIVDSSTEYIRTNLLNQVQFILEKVNCINHEFVPVGHGYECENCHYYTGMNQVLNTLIKNELDKEFLKRQHEPRG